MREFELIARLAPYLAQAGEILPVPAGDDAAVLRTSAPGLCVTVDVLVEGRHFLRPLSSPADIGWKALAVNCSDLAAMAARPLAAVVGLCCPPGFTAAEVEGLYGGMAAAAQRWDTRLVGGDTVEGDALVVSVTALGEVDPERAVRRSGAQPGDALVLLGDLGAAAAGLGLAQAGESAPEALLAAHRRPRALVDGGRILAEHGARAMIDVSDGLGADLARLCAASQVAARLVAEEIPVGAAVHEAAARLGVDVWELVCGGGEDFALVAALPSDRAQQAARAAAAAEGVPAAVIGTVHHGGPPLATLAVGDRVEDISAMGYEHFTGR